MSNPEALWRRATPPLIAALIRSVGRSMRIDVINEEGIARRWRRGEASILAFWHGRQLMLPLAYHGSGIDLLISRHRDGELISRAMRSFGFGAVRGSTTRGGAFALRALVAAGREGRDLGITPDGPKGPRGRVQPGVIQLARLTGLPVFPLAFGASKKKSWIPGTDSCFPIRLRAECFVGATPSGFPAIWTTRHLKSGGGRWSGRSRT